MADANPCRMEGRMTECNAMKRPGKPATGNPFVRFDEGRSGDTGLTTMVCLICYSPLRLLYPSAPRSSSQPYPAVTQSGSGSFSDTAEKPVQVHSKSRHRLAG